MPEQPAEPQKGSATGQPIPRFAALRSDEVNMRVGPGTRYPVDWVYRRKDMPVEILREFEVWRLIRDPEGNQGWVHTAVLTGRRTFVIRDQQNQPLRRRADAESSEVATLRPGVIGRIRGCEPGTEWCQVQVGSYRGYLPRSSFWGTYQGEEITN